MATETISRNTNRLNKSRVITMPWMPMTNRRQSSMAPYVPRTKRADAEQRDEIDAESEDRLRKTHPQIDRIRRMSATGQDVDRRTSPRKPPQGDARDQSHCSKGEHKHCGQPPAPETVDQRDQEGAAQTDDKDIERMEGAAHHFDSVKASIESVFFES